MTQEELISCLEKINFTNLESQIYLALLEGGEMSAYQLAKKINISRPSIYNALEHMYDKGSVEMIPESTALYIAQAPEVLLKKLNYEFEKNTSLLSKGLKGFMETRHDERFANFKGFETTIFKAKELLRTAKSEVYINADFDLLDFKEDFTSLNKRGIRVIVFSFNELNMKGLEVEYYSHNRKVLPNYKPSRLMIAIDNSEALVADCYKERDTWQGTITNNTLMVTLICEHIHNDIYLLNFRNKYGQEVFSDEILLHSAFETRPCTN